MKGEVDFFRKRFVGGFNREDVINYVAKLSKERNELSEEKDKAVQDARALAAQVTALRHELETARKAADDYKVEALDAAGRTFDELETVFMRLRAEVEAATAGVCTELKTAVGTIAKVPSILEVAGNKLADLKSVLDAERSGEPEYQEPEPDIEADIQY